MFTVRRIIGDDWADTTRSKWTRERASLEIDYTAYGLPDAIVGLVTDPWADFDGDGDVDATDTNTFLALYAASDAKADRNVDGQWTFADVQLFSADVSAAGQTLTPTGRLNEEENPFGLDGYRHDAITGLYHVRHRVLDPEQGKWMQRDPAGFVDGGNLLVYAMGSPVAHRDSDGRYASGWLGGTITDVYASIPKTINLTNQTYTQRLGVNVAVDANFYHWFVNEPLAPQNNAPFQVGMTIQIQWYPQVVPIGGKPCCTAYQWEQRYRVNDGTRWYPDGTGGAAYAGGSFGKYNPGPPVPYPKPANLFDSPSQGLWMPAFWALPEKENDFESQLICVAGFAAGTVMAKVSWGWEAWQTEMMLALPVGPGPPGFLTFTHVDAYATGRAW